MSKRRLILIACIAALAVAMGIYFLMPREPSYGGKKLSEWLEVVDTATKARGGHDDESYQQATNAIRQIGTKGLPCLLRWYGYHPPKWRSIFSQLGEKLPELFVQVA